MDFISKLPNKPSDVDTIWVVVNKLTMSSYSLSNKEANKDVKADQHVHHGKCQTA